ncbi:unnamed protein product [Ambrosiozyma monospora]|uniref:Unnamed protein product n=1 Tax=Ambrosiozyma monospora TaxID=43982 RepID=A0A9W7DIT0_AMBMO|nr:unnamed protein product [Ambrosiozyma monospora]
MNLEFNTRFQTTRKRCLHDAEQQYQDKLETPIEIDSTGTPIQQFQQRMLKEYLDNTKQHHFTTTWKLLWCVVMGKRDILG